MNWWRVFLHLAAIFTTCSSLSVTSFKSRVASVYCLRTKVSRLQSGVKLSANPSIIDSKSIYASANTESIMSKVSKAANTTVTTFAAASVTALATTIIAGHMKAAVPMLNSYELTQNHMGPLVAGLLTASLYYTFSDFGTDMSSILSRDRFSFPRQVLRVTSAVIGIGLGLPLAIAGPAVEVGMTMGRIFSNGQNSELLKNCVAAGVCAGFTTMFEAPVAGVLYFLEAIRPMVKGAPTTASVEERHLTPTSILDDNLTLGCLVLGAAIASTILFVIPMLF